MAKAIRSGWTVLRAGAAVALALALTQQAHAADASTASLQPEQVRMVQRALSEYGYEVGLSGRWDDATRGAIGAFQSDNDLPATGALDGATSRALGVDPWAVTPVAGTSPAAADARADPAIDCRMNNTVDCAPGQ